MWLPGVIAGVLETDAIWRRGGGGQHWQAGHTLALQHLLSFRHLEPLNPSFTNLSLGGGDIPSCLPPNHRIDSACRVETSSLSSSKVQILSLLK